jgi:hypothetical protein
MYHLVFRDLRDSGLIIFFVSQPGIILQQIPGVACIVIMLYFYYYCINYLDNSIIIKCPSNTAPHCHILFRSSLFQTPLIPSIGKLGCRRLQLSFYTVPHMPSEPRFQTPLEMCHLASLGVFSSLPLCRACPHGF